MCIKNKAIHKESRFSLSVLHLFLLIDFDSLNAKFPITSILYPESILTGEWREYSYPYSDATWAKGWS